MLRLLRTITALAVTCVAGGATVCGASHDDVLPPVRTWRARAEVAAAVVAGAKSPGAAEFVYAHAERFDLPPSVELVPTDVSHSLTGRHVRLRPLMGGLPVFGGEYAVHADAEGRVRSVSWTQVPKRVAADKSAISLSQAISIASAGSGRLRFEPTAELVVYAHGGSGIPAWAVRVPAASPPGDWLVLLRASDGAEMLRYDAMCAVEGTGRVFVDNAVIAARDPYLEDGGDADSAVPESAYSLVTLLGLADPVAGFYRMAGDYVILEDIEYPNDPLPQEASPYGFIYSRSNDWFEHVMVYWHIDYAQRYIQSLGFTDACNKPLSCDAHGLSGADNSHYSPWGEYIAFGDGGVDDAEDGEIILHEYGHAIQYDVVPGYAPGIHTQARAMGEGFADYNAVTICCRLSGGYLDEYIGEWDATYYSAEMPPYLRRIDTLKRYPDDWVGEEHADGQIWSGALWQIRGACGPDVADRIVYEYNYHTSNNPTFAESAQALLQADDLLYDRRNHEEIYLACGPRGLLPELSESASPAGWLHQGWNLVSLPLQPVEPHTDSVLDDVIAAGNNLYLRVFSYSPRAGYAAYPEEGMEELSAGRGYWLYLTESAVELLRGLPVPRVPAPDADEYVRDEVPDLPIPDPGDVASVLTVPADPPPPPISGIELRITLWHESVRDLIISLESPAGTEVIVQNHAAFSGPWTTANTPELAAFVGEEPGGDWTLRIYDAWTGDSGALDEWSLLLSSGTVHTVDLLQGWNLFGHTGTDPVPWADCLISDGAQALPVADAAAGGWITQPAYYYDDGYKPVPGDDTELRPWRGYWLRALVDGLTLLIP